MWSAQVPTALYLATLAATQPNYVIRKSYRNQCAVGKPKKIALISTIHPLPSLLNTKIEAQIPWIEECQASQET